MAAYTPIQLQSDALLALHAANPQRYPVLLQSAASSDSLGQFDLLLAFPQGSIEARVSGISTSDSSLNLGDSFLGSLDRWFKKDCVPPISDAPVPFSGGWFVFLAYEVANEIEATLRLPRDGSTPTAVMLRVPCAIAVRKSDGAAWIVDESGDSVRVARVRRDLFALPQANVPAETVLAQKLVEDPGEHYLQAVRSTLEHIAAGDVYQANISRAWRGRLKDSIRPVDVYARLRRANPAPFAASVVFDSYAIVSSSPERLLRVRHNGTRRIADTRPIAGTRPRRMDHQDDLSRREELRAHPKERAEHVMLIDLERNDLGRICKAGTVKVDEFMTLESYAHVHHIVSNVSGELRDEITPGQALAAVFPGGTITGCPKVRCMEIIAQLEKTPRRAYTGALGYINRDGTMDFNILIRTIEISGAEVCLRAGAGIVADSIPERELEETRAKARGLVRALEENF